ncbi:NAD(P)/FAD-dependent oxidoreductase [Actinocorallia populi]|uniref:NAD(P)/FAD-dependent oxidoreductase n=1 Tax=Actinocorallia populi TaxID=2079200 RepID=UPI000D089B97|nr:FAD-dependent oxidoreductase [Actinocorallia populi]
MYDLIIVGGGIIGCGIAEWSRMSLSRICIIEQSDKHLTQGTSAAAAGGINPFLDDDVAEGLGLMAARSRSLYRDWAKRLGAESGRPLCVRRTGLLQLAVDEAEVDRLGNRVQPRLHELGVDNTLLTGDEAREREPLLGPEVLAALEQPEDLVAEPMKIMSALHRVLRADERVETVHARAVAVRTANGRVDVELADGRVLTGERAVVAAGHRSGGLLAGHGVPSGVFQPVKGQILDMRVPPGGAPGYLCDMVTHETGGERVAFVAPYTGDRIAAGVTFEPDETDPTPLPAKARQLILPNLRRALPKVADYEILGFRAGIRPKTADGIPLVGFVDQDRRVMAATGHGGWGLTLAPRTAQLAAGLLADRRPPSGDDRADLALCDPLRFAGRAL